ncbi:MAG: ABC transporter ATP-binding protein [Candidatus Rifleibacteriota bacterium]
MIRFENINMSYDEKSVLENVSAIIEPGSSVCLLGLNGAGKTTLLEILYGLKQPDSGKISILDLDPHKDLEEMRQKVIFVSENCHLYPQMNATDLQAFMKPMYKKWSDEIFKQKIESFKVDPKTRVKNLSKGSKHKLMLALALAAQPEVMILDEPLAGFDPAVREEVVQTVISSLCDHNMTILISTHLIDEVANVCDKVLILHDRHFALAESSENIEKNCRRVIVELEEEISFAPSGENIVGSSMLGKRLELLMKNCSDEMVPEQLKGLKVKSFGIEKLSLKDLFLGLTRN